MVRYLDGRPIAETAVAAPGGVLGNKTVMVILATCVLIVVVVLAAYWRMA